MPVSRLLEQYFSGFLHLLSSTSSSFPAGGCVSPAVARLRRHRRNSLSLFFFTFSGDCVVFLVYFSPTTVAIVCTGWLAYDSGVITFFFGEAAGSASDFDLLWRMRSRIGRGSSPLGDDSDLGKALCVCGVGMEEISTLVSGDKSQSVKTVEAASNTCPSSLSG
ncbi:hypothetical protein DY000_02006133 [Brassica cretica]|uniref:Uncharacterized protein n=1 Tax=Brassica cretica TaxID=69181 RepID=A0ABQ7BSA3_BRACR|nr:hypothetical protein DY000_02006133 [Brassica cretica]